jgi:hypothetical protein
MKELLAEMETHLEQLQIGHERQKANIHAQEGAMQECEYMIEQIKKRIIEEEPVEAENV